MSGSRKARETAYKNTRKKRMPGSQLGRDRQAGRPAGVGERVEGLDEEHLKCRECEFVRSETEDGVEKGVIGDGMERGATKNDDCRQL